MPSVRYGPRYLVVGSRLTDDSNVLRILLEGLNTQARQWTETIIILDDGSLAGLGSEVAEFRHLEHRPINNVTDAKPNIVIAFMDRLHFNRETEYLLRSAEEAGIPAYVVSRYGV